MGGFEWREYRGLVLAEAADLRSRAAEHRISSDGVSHPDHAERTDGPTRELSVRLGIDGRTVHEPDAKRVCRSTAGAAAFRPRSEPEQPLGSGRGGRDRLFDTSRLRDYGSPV